MTIAFDASQLDAIRSVQIHWADDYQNPTLYLIPASDVPAFVEATVALHGGEHKNPHNGETTRRAVEIHVVELVVTGPYWWTTPSLQAKAGSGARVIAPHGDRSIAWQCPDFLSECTISPTPQIEAQ